MKINAIVTGATGMVGEGVLHECLLDPDVEKVLVINRRPGGVVHPKLTEIIHSDFFNLSPLQDRLKGYNACFFCLGVTSIGKKEPEYTRLTYELTLQAAGIMLKENPGMTFCYVSGANTDSSEKGRSMWARVKGKTENELLKLGFYRAYMFRPGFMRPTPGLKNAQKFYSYIDWMYPLLHVLFPKFVSTLRQLGRAMINVVKFGYEKNVLEVRDINALAEAG
jgi:uncharacterized protein YbjT (DUF2867 family)